MKLRSQILIAVLATAFALPATAQAEPVDFLHSKRLYAGLALGVSLWSFKAAYEARQDGSDFYDQYKVAGTAQTARESYDESKKSDTKAALWLGVGLTTLAYSIHAFVSEEKDLSTPEMREGLLKMKGVRMDLHSDPYRGGLRLNLKKGF